MPTPLIFFFAAVSFVARIVPHVPNVVPVGALTFTTARHAGALRASIAMFVVMLASDRIIGPHDFKMTLAVYAGFLLYVVAGRLSAKGAVGRIQGMAGSACGFFILTNGAVWLWSGMYPHTIIGLTQCYIAALPFLAFSLAGDMGYLFVFEKLLQVYRSAVAGVTYLIRPSV